MKLTEIKTLGEAISQIVIKLKPTQEEREQQSAQTAPLLRTTYVPRGRHLPPRRTSAHQVCEEANAVVLPVIKKKQSKAERLAAFNKKKAEEEAFGQQVAQACVRDKKLRAIELGLEKFSACARQKASDSCGLSLFLQKNLKDLHEELEQLKTIVERVEASGEWSQANQYAVLQSFACVNELVALQHWDDATRRVARSLRNATFKQHELVLKMVANKEGLLGMVNAWIRFLETTDVPGNLRDEQAVFTRVGSNALEQIYSLGQLLPRCIDIAKSKSALTEMVAFVANHKEISLHKNLIDFHAFSFCWGVMDSNLKDLLTIANRRHRPAQKVFKNLKSYYPT